MKSKQQVEMKNWSPKNISFFMVFVMCVNLFFTNVSFARRLRGNTVQLVANELFSSNATRKLRIAFDLGGTLAAADKSKKVDLSIPEKERWMHQYVPQEGLQEVLQVLKDRGHTLIMWTTALTVEVETIFASHPEILGLFDEVYTKDTGPAPATDIISGEIVHGIKYPGLVKADLVVDDAYPLGPTIIIHCDGPRGIDVVDRTKPANVLDVEKFVPGKAEDPYAWIEPLARAIQDLGG